VTTSIITGLLGDTLSLQLLNNTPKGGTTPLRIPFIFGSEKKSSVRRRQKHQLGSLATKSLARIFGAKKNLTDQAV